MKKQFVQKLKSSMEKVKTILSKEEDNDLKCSDYEDNVPPPPKKKSYSIKEQPMFGNSDPHTYGL
ncbi:MAG: hypothetical protein LHW59_05330 [Candidatus Cloacimonetes bacterium]|jgi:uncharacterized membrane protein|nr:hypothetical protein [Candidatus Cloacimonadota bacterium]